MKKALLFALCMFLLCGCKAKLISSDEPSKAVATPQVEETAVIPTAQMTVCREPDSLTLPKTDFEVDSIWLSDDSFNGKALLLLDSLADGIGEFVVFSTQKFDRLNHFQQENKMIYTDEIHGKIYNNGKNMSFDAVDSFKTELTGEAKIDGDAMEIIFINSAATDPFISYDFFNPYQPKMHAGNDDIMNYDVYLPVCFAEIDEESALRIWTEMPLFKSEINQTVQFTTSQDELTAVFGEPKEISDDGQQVYFTFENACAYAYPRFNGELHITYLKVESSENSPTIRGVGVGCHINDILERVPNHFDNFDTMMKEFSKAEYKHTSKPIYGYEDSLSAFGAFRAGEENYLQLSTIGMVWAKFYMDEQGTITSISYHRF